MKSDLDPKKSCFVEQIHIKKKKKILSCESTHNALSLELAATVLDITSTVFFLSLFLKKIFPVVTILFFPADVLPPPAPLDDNVPLRPS